ncbi:MAG: DUF928 domain-containing protein [Cyanobacteriota bacterium]|nr:DUF928 domain-containing protein [Cyanobacteriota bacterium]
MIRFNSIVSITLAVLLEFLLGLGFAIAQTGLAQTIKSNPPQPPNRGTPSNDDGTPATRGNCPKTDLSLRSIVPNTEAESPGFTLSEYPIFWFYVPYESDDISQGILRIEDREGNLHAQVSFILPQTPGFVSVPLQWIEKPLEKNKQYYWIFMLDCESPEFAEPDRDWQQGWIERVDRPDLEMQLQTATVEQRLDLYWENQIWYDAPTNLVEIHQLSSTWRKLLQTVGMESYASEPIAGSVELVEDEEP